MRKRNILAAVAAATSVGSASALSSALNVAEIRHHMGRTRYPKGWGPSGQGFCPVSNRHTGQPHEHKREILRRLRQRAVA